MKNYAASVRAKLKNQVKISGEPLNFLELQYVQERFLYRLSQSKYKYQFILKGGILFYVWSNNKYRPTKDLDFMFYGSLEQKELLDKLKYICSLQFPEDGIEFLLDSFSFELIKEGHEYEGVRINFIALIDTSRVNMKLDICTGDKITPEPKEYSFPKIFADLELTRLKMYPKETVIAEKVHAMISLDLANSRMNDFSDLSDRDQILRVLRKLINENKLIRIGQGVYARAKISTLTNKPVPEKNLRAITALKKSGVSILPTRMEKEYNEGKSTQVPTGLVIGVNKRVSRKIGFNGRYIKYEKVSQS